MGAMNQRNNIKSILHVADERRIWPKCKRGITGVPFGRTELSIWLWTFKSGAL